MKKRYTYKLRPGKQAQADLAAEASRCRWVWNECVHIFNMGEYRNSTQLDKMLTEARSKLSWLRDGSSVAQQQVIRDFSTAVNNFFKKKSGKPKHKKRKNSKVSLNYTTRGFTIDENRRLKLPKKVSIPVVWSRVLPSEPSSVRVYQDSCGDWWASFVVEVEESSCKKKREDNGIIGMDFGLKTVSTTTDAHYDLQYSSSRKRHERNYVKYQRRMAMHRENQKWDLYKKSKRLAAKEKRAEKRIRKEQNRNWAQKVARNHRAVAVDDLKVSFMTRGNLAKKTYDVGIYQIKQELKVACQTYNSEFILVDPKNTTQECCCCGARTKHPLTLKDRIYNCESCGISMDRDRNSAFVIMNRAGLNPAPEDGMNLTAWRSSFFLDSKYPDGGIPRL